MPIHQYQFTPNSTMKLSYELRAIKRNPSNLHILGIYKYCVKYTCWEVYFIVVYLKEKHEGLLTQLDE